MLKTYKTLAQMAYKILEIQAAADFDFYNLHRPTTYTGLV